MKIRAILYFLYTFPECDGRIEFEEAVIGAPVEYDVKEILRTQSCHQCWHNFKVRKHLCGVDHTTNLQIPCKCS